jgi:hypothetical protein
MNDDWQTASYTSVGDEEEAPLSLDHEGIPILNEIVDPDAIQSESSVNALQQDFFLLESEPADQDAQASEIQALLRSELIEEIRKELMTVIETTSHSIADEIRDDLAATVKEALVEAVEKKLQAISEAGPETDTGSSDNLKP